MADMSIPIAWWDKKNPIPSYQSIFAIVETLHKRQIDRNSTNLRCLRLYGNADISGMTPYQYTTLTQPSLPENRVKINIISSMCDTVTAKIAKMKPHVTFLTEGGGFKAQRQAKQLDQFIGGLFYQNKIYQHGRQCFKDATIFDIGVLKHFRQGNKIVTERVLPTELYVDESDALYGRPTHMYQVKYMQKAVLEEMFPKYKAAIRASKGILNELSTTMNTVTEYVVVIEAWHLRSGPNAKDGRHVISISNEELFSEEYTKDHFPFTFFRWSTKQVGFFGQSLAERLIGNQIEINKMLRMIQRAFHLGSSFKVFLEHGSRVVQDHINNEVGAIVYYTGTEPKYSVPQTVHPEYFQHLERLIKASYEEAGVSQLSAQSKMPAGMEASVAMRTYQDIESDRFVLVGQQYEEMYLDIATHYVELSNEIVEDGDEIEAFGDSKRFLKSIKWSEVRLPSESFVMKMFPTSSLPHDPEGRLQMVQEMMQNGIVDREMGLRLLNFPDLDSEMAYLTASSDILHQIAEKMLVDGKYVGPEPVMDLEGAKKFFVMAYLRAKIDGVKEENLALVRDWLSECQAMLDTAAQTQAQIQPPQPQQPQMAPQQMPQPPVLPGAAPQ